MNPSPPLPETPEHRAALSRAAMERTGLDAATIERFLRVFYAAARSDPLLATAFAEVTDWEAHIARIATFWRSVALLTGEYHGTPMQAHAGLGLTPAHFARWLELFERTARAELGPGGAAHMLDRARRIARSLELGLVPLPTAPRRVPPAAGRAA